MPNIINPFESPTDDVDRGLDYVQAELRAGRCGLYVGHGPNNGFAVIVGHTKTATMAGGVVIGVPLNPLQLTMLRDNCERLLKEHRERKPLEVKSS